MKDKINFWNDEHLLKKQCAVFQVFFSCFFYICGFSIFYVHREIKGIFEYCNSQACTVVYATV